MITVDEDDVVDTAEQVAETIADTEADPEVAIAAMMLVCRHLAKRVGPPTDEVLDWAVRRLDEGEEDP